MSAAMPVGAAAASPPEGAGGRQPWRGSSHARTAEASRDNTVTNAPEHRYASKRMGDLFTMVNDRYQRSLTIP